MILVNTMFWYYNFRNVTLYLNARFDNFQIQKIHLEKFLLDDFLEDNDAITYAVNIINYIKYAGIYDKIYLLRQNDV